MGDERYETECLACCGHMDRVSELEDALRELLSLAKEGSKSELVKRGAYIAYALRLGDALEAAEKALSKEA